ncbi:MAG: hypothetical protein ABI947_23765 [Chloroflexota bacterium]
MIPSRTQVKFFLDNPETVDSAALASFSRLFQRWIQQHALEGMLIDVADYRHVFEGPSVVLIGHDSDYAIEKRDGRLGLLFTRKRQVDTDLATQLRTSLRLALAAANLLESEPTFTPTLKFRADEIEIRFLDRLQLPNRPETFDLVKDDLQAVLTELFGTEAVTFAPASQDQRLPFTVDVRSQAAARISELLHHLQPSVEK